MLKKMPTFLGWSAAAAGAEAGPAASACGGGAWCGSYLLAQSSPSRHLLRYSTYLMPRKPQPHDERQQQADDQAAAPVGLCTAHAPGHRQAAGDEHAGVHGAQVLVEVAVGVDEDFRDDWRDRRRRRRKARRRAGSR